MMGVSIGGLSGWYKVILFNRLFWVFSAGAPALGGVFVLFSMNVDGALSFCG